MFLVLITSIWYGILSSINPCPMTTNISALSFLSKELEHPVWVLINGIMYTLGRTLLYVILGLFLSFSMDKIPGVSFFLQEKFYYIFAPILIFIGLILTGVIKIHVSPQITSRISHKLAKGDMPNIIITFLMGVLFACALCPPSAALFFGNLIQNQGRIISLIGYGIGTGIPVLILAFIIAFSMHNIAHTHARMVKFEKIAGKITGIIFILAGIYSLYSISGV